MNYDTIVKGGKTLRFHTDYMIDRQDVGQHSFQCSLLAYQIGSQMIINQPKLDIDQNRIVVNMLLHDMPEQYAGDIPGHIKTSYSKMREAFQRAEKDWCDVNLNDSEMKIFYAKDYLESQLTTFIDLFDCAMTAIRECRLGNNEDMDFIAEKCLEGLKSIIMNIILTDELNSANVHFLKSYRDKVVNDLSNVRNKRS